MLKSDTKNCNIETPNMKTHNIYQKIPLPTTANFNNLRF